MAVWKVTEGTGDFEAFVNARNLFEAEYIWAKRLCKDDKETKQEIINKYGPLVKTEKSVNDWISECDSQFQVNTRFVKINENSVPPRFLPKAGRVKVHDLWSGDEDSD